ncbi:MAG: hypothetical protein U9N61_10045 [Euryarchaeota archaeon]|nr:hypothetical protein [Euryarchaeota archaeon]
MKATNQQLLEGKSALEQMLELEIPDIKIAYQLGRNLRKITKALHGFQEEDKALLEIYAEKDENGKIVVSEKRIQLMPETAAEFHELKTTELEREVEVDIWLIPFNDLQKIQDSFRKDKITMRVIYLLEWMMQRE